MKIRNINILMCGFHQKFLRHEKEIQNQFLSKHETPHFLPLLTNSGKIVVPTDLNPWVQQVYRDSNRNAETKMSKTDVGILFGKTAMVSFNFNHSSNFMENQYNHGLLNLN